MFIQLHQLHRITDFANPETDQLTLVNTDHIIFVDAMTRDERVCSLLRLTTGDTTTVSEPPAVVVHLIWVATTSQGQVPVYAPAPFAPVFPGDHNQQTWWQNPTICKTTTDCAIKDVG